MLIDAATHVSGDPVAAERAALMAEANGYDGFSASETKHDPFVSLALPPAPQGPSLSGRRSLLPSLAIR